MYAPRKVFIIENGGYTELTYTEFCRRREIDRSYKDKLFLTVQGCLLESDEEHYVDFYRDKEHWRYLIRLDRKNGLLSIDAFESDDDNGYDFIPDQTVDVAETVVHNEMIRRLREELFLLPEDERLLIQRHFYEGISQVDLGEMYGKSQSTISRRIAKILLKLKNLLEN